MKHKDNPADATKAIQDLLESQEQWLILRLRGKALVRNTSKAVGTNISWSVLDDVLRARDHVTGRKLRMDQVLFERPVELLMCGELDGEDISWTVKIKGTTKEVLEKIYSEYKRKSDDTSHVIFQGLDKQSKGKYYLNLSS
jgi:hypothetical protein